MTASRFSPISFASCTTSLIISSRECVVTCTTTEVTLTLKQKLEADEKPFGNASIQTHAWTQDGRTIQKHDASVAQKKQIMLILLLSDVTVTVTDPLYHCISCVPISDN